MSLLPPGPAAAGGPRGLAAGMLCAAVLTGAGAAGAQEGGAAVPQTGGKIVDTERRRDDPSVLSPPIVVEPLLACGQSVTVEGFVPSADVKVLESGTGIGGGTGTITWGQVFPVSPSLATGQGVTATQTFGGTTSGPSPLATVQDHTAVYPNGLPPPGLPWLPLYKCGIATVADALPPGGSVRVEATPPGGAAALVGQVVGVEAKQSIGIGPPFEQGHSVVAHSQICSDVSPPSVTAVVQPPPATLPAPQVAAVWDGGTWLVVGQLVNGARVTIEKGGQTIGGGGAPAGVVRFPMNPPVSANDPLEIKQELCGVDSPTTTTTVQPCSALPPPIMQAPFPGDTVVHLADFVVGARILIYASGQEVGDGGPPSVQLTRALADGETVVAVQMLGSCTSQTAHQLEVGKGLDDPAEHGRCSAERWEYGAPGSADLRTTDVSSYFNSPDASVNVPMSAVPLHGLVRYPSGLGPFPLVLIVHGNHSPTDPSEGGYDYLLDLLASHCMIAVSVDENFLNGWVGGEMDARAIVLLRHLQLWREWHRTPGHRFFTKVDLASIGLAGHSRGGEAITVAEAYNRTKHAPADPAHDFGFGIRSLYAIAPVDGQIDDAALANLTVTGADYYVMHGSHDGDVSNFPGHRTYDRAFPVTSPAARFKGLLFIHGANHGQWNTGWGTTSESTVDPVAKRISGSDQRSIAEAYMGAFYLSTLRGYAAYKHLFQGTATFSSLPAGVTRVFQYQDPQRTFVNHYEEDDDPATGSFAGVTNGTLGPPSPYEDHTFSDRGPPYWLWEQTDGLIAGWSGAGREVVVQIPPALAALAPSSSALVLRVGQVYEEAPSLNAVGASKDLTVQLKLGTVDSKPVLVSSIVALPYPDVTNHPNRGNETKTVMQTVRIPWAAFFEGGRPRRLDRLREIRIKLDRHRSGLLALDELQFSR